jgi:hypothetical protein
MGPTTGGHYRSHRIALKSYCQLCQGCPKIKANRRTMTFNLDAVKREIEAKLKDHEGQ